MTVQEPTTKKKSTTIHRTFEGEVVSATENKTVHVLIKTQKVHPKYKKRYSVSKKYAAHDETNGAVVGDVVRIQECRPLSKTKRWRVVGVVSNE